MVILEIPTRIDLPAYNEVVTLDGTPYQIDLQWNDRMSKWMILLSDAQGNELVGYVPIVSTWPLFNRFKFDGLPPGTLFAFDSSGQNIDPGRFDLGDRVKLCYLEAGT